MNEINWVTISFLFYKWQNFLVQPETHGMSLRPKTGAISIIWCLFGRCKYHEFLWGDISEYIWNSLPVLEFYQFAVDASATLYCRRSVWIVLGRGGTGDLVGENFTEERG